MRFDQFTIKAQEAIAAAQTEAAKKDHPEVTPEHLLRALLTQERGVVPAILGKLGADTATLLAEIEKGARRPARHKGRADSGLRRHGRCPQAGATRGRDPQGPVRLE